MMPLRARDKKSSSVKLSNNIGKVDEEDGSVKPRCVLKHIDILMKELFKHEKLHSRRQLAQALHEKADSLILKGDYETALILYYRAASMYPRDISHNAAVRHTSAVILSKTNPHGALRELLHETKNPISLMRTLCPETAARQAQQILHNSRDPYENMKQILQYIDTRGTISGNIHLKKRNVVRINKPNMMLRQWNEIAASKLCEMKRFFIAGDWETTLNIGSEFTVIVQAYQHHYYYRVVAHRYMALSHSSLGRHDRAVSQVTRMIQAAKKSADEELILRSMAVLGKVHLTFGHLNAAARAWRRLSHDVNNPISKAWLFHEIGRCYFEMSNYSKALKMSRRCIASSEVANSCKWLCYGKLLNGQALIELGRLTEALETLEFVGEIARTQIKDLAMLNYVEDLIIRVSKFIGQDSEYKINNREKIIDITTSSKISNSNIKKSNVDASIPSARNFSKQQESVDISSTVGSRVFSSDNKEQESHLNDICATKENSIETDKSSATKSCRIIDKWKNSYCSEKHFPKPKFDFVNSTSNDMIAVNANLNARPRVLRSIVDTIHGGKWTSVMVESKKSYPTKRYMGSDWRKISPEFTTPMGVHEFEQNAKSFPSSSLAIFTEKTYDIAHPRPLHRHSLPTNLRPVSNDQKKNFLSPMDFQDLL